MNDHEQDQEQLLRIECKWVPRNSFWFGLVVGFAAATILCCAAAVVLMK